MPHEEKNMDKALAFINVGYDKMCSAHDVDQSYFNLVTKEFSEVKKLLNIY